jgi:hypothetical protein
MFDIVERGAQLVSASQHGNYTLDVLPYVSHDNLKSMLPAMLPNLEGVTVGSVASSVFNVWTISKVLAFVIVAANFKNFPLVYHVCLGILPVVRFAQKLIFATASSPERFSVCLEMSTRQERSITFSALPAHHHLLKELVIGN